VKICMVTTFYPPYNHGGDGLFVQQLARDLVATGHEVHVVHSVDAFRATGGVVDSDVLARETVDGIQIHRMDENLGLLPALVTQQTGRPVRWGRLRSLLESGFDVINYHNISLIGGPEILRFGRGTKLFTLHEHWWVCPTHILWKYTGELCTQPSCLRCCIAQRTPPQAWRLMRGWMARCLSSVDVILAPSRFTAERYREWMDRHGADASMQLLSPYTMPIPDGTPRVDLPERYFLWVGRLTVAKGIRELIDRFSARPDYPLVVVGDGELSGELRARCPDNVRIVGRVPRQQLGPYYRRATALVVSSLCAETFGMTASEALSCGTPVLTSACGGTEDIVGDEVGFIYRTVDELLAALDELWSCPQERDRLAGLAKERYRARYSPSRYLAAYGAIIEAAQRAAGHS